ncbi:uncharacterized protein PF3D7_1120600-like [Daktulosphaira vitifoliae]|uniref:uncharacterized protein PF3D7_1120600-like n=1 Tax=Daktulosphaira vitifoliae TaxID=58002 RepID=UPI0021AA98FA|nr:uncharacterized protein PF3D7_1120600-like [Daktulosphaira vitifoliae]
MSFLDIVSKFNQQAVEHTQSQALNPFSGQFDQSRSPSPRFSREEYGKPIAGSKTDMRGRKAKTHICREILELCTVIHDVGSYNLTKKSPDDNSNEFDDGTIIVTFGEIFQIYTKISDKVVGLLIAAKRRGFVFFDREILYQRRDDDVLIALMKPITEINKILKAEIEEANAPPPSQPTTQVITDEANLKKPVAMKLIKSSNNDSSNFIKDSIKVNGIANEDKMSDVPMSQVVVVEITDECDNKKSERDGEDITNDSSNEVCDNEKLEVEKSTNNLGVVQESRLDSQSVDSVCVGEIVLDDIEKDVGGVHEIIINAIDSVVKNDIQQEDFNDKTNGESKNILVNTEVTLKYESLGDIRTKTEEEKESEETISEGVEVNIDTEKTIERELDEFKLDNNINFDEAKENQINIENNSYNTKNKDDSNEYSVNDYDDIENKIETNIEGEKNEDNSNESNLVDKICPDDILILNVYEVVNKESVELDKNKIDS